VPDGSRSVRDWMIDAVVCVVAVGMGALAVLSAPRDEDAGWVVLLANWLSRG
jgi:hypothetical protein